ncbi:MAG: hypothetical protein Q613_PSC00258G0001, partial [Propionibacterium sp. DORA_15]
MTGMTMTIVRAMRVGVMRAKARC